MDLDIVNTIVEPNGQKWYQFKIFNGRPGQSGAGWKYGWLKASQICQIQTYDWEPEALRLRQITNHIIQVKLFSAIAAAAVIGGSFLIAPTPAEARPLPVPHSGTCSFNGVKERCVVEWDTDGSLNVTYLSDGKRVSYGTGDGKVYDGNRTFNAAVSNRGSYYIFTTQNGQTVIPAY